MPEQKAIQLKTDTHSSESEGQNSYVNKLEVTVTSRLGKDESLSITDCTSSYTEFIHHHCAKSDSSVRRDHEPSRIPLKQLTHVFQKSRKIRKLVKKYIIKNVPHSSQIHLYTTFRHIGVTVVVYSNTDQFKSAPKVKPRKKRVFTSHHAVASHRRNHKVATPKSRLRENHKFQRF